MDGVTCSEWLWRVVLLLVLDTACVLNCLPVDIPCLRKFPTTSVWTITGLAPSSKPPHKIVAFDSQIPRHHHPAHRYTCTGIRHTALKIHPRENSKPNVDPHAYARHARLRPRNNLPLCLHTGPTAARWTLDNHSPRHFRPHFIAHDQRYRKRATTYTFHTCHTCHNTHHATNKTRQATANRGPTPWHRTPRDTEQSPQWPEDGRTHATRHNGLTTSRPGMTKHIGEI